MVQNEAIFLLLVLIILIHNFCGMSLIQTFVDTVLNAVSPERTRGDRCISRYKGICASVGSEIVVS